MPSKEFSKDAVMESCLEHMMAYSMAMQKVLLMGLHLALLKAEVKAYQLEILKADSTGSRLVQLMATCLVL